MDSLKKDIGRRRYGPGKIELQPLPENWEAAGEEDQLQKFTQDGPRKILKFGSDVPEIHKIFQNKFGPKRNSDEEEINLPRRIKPAGIQIRKEFSEN